MEAKIRKLLDAIDKVEFYQEVFDGWDGKSNLPCPFAAERHEKGRDSNPSFVVFSDTGGTFCHACGYKANLVEFWAKYKGIPMAKATGVLWCRYVEQTIPEEVYLSAARKLQVNKLILEKLRALRGITQATALKFHLGYDGQRLTIPIFNEEGYCVNIRRYDLFKTNGPKMVSWKAGFGSARLFPVESLRGPTVFICEGELDAIIGCQLGVDCITPAGGALTWKVEWSKLFKGKLVYVVPDSDQAGLQGASERLKSLSTAGVSCAMLKLPEMKDGKDLTDWVVKHEGTKEKLLALASALNRTGSTLPTGKVTNQAPEIGSSSGNQGSLYMEQGRDEGKLVDRAMQVWGHLNVEGKFFRNIEGELFYVKEDAEPVRVTDTPGPFMAMLTRLSPLINQATLTGKFIYKYIQNNTFAWGELSKTGVWSLYDKGVLYVHAGAGKVLRLAEGAFSTIKNAVNDDHVLLDAPTKGISVHALPNSMPADGLSNLRTFFLEAMPMSEEDRYFLLCWLTGVFLRDYIRPKPIIRLLASTASGKSTVSKLVSTLIYGEELLSHSASTLAATYEMSNRFPLLILDNLETSNMIPELMDFLLIAATGGMKVKRKASTDHGLVMERTDCLVLTNGIEPFNRHELIDRTVEMGLDIKKYGSLGFHESKVFEELRTNRQKIMSALLYLLSKYVLPRIRKGELSRIIKAFGPHGKERFNEYLALMSLILDAFWGYMPLEAYAKPQDLVSYWLDSQTRALTAQDVGTDDVLYYINTLYDKHAQIVGTSLNFEAIGGGTVLHCTTRELLTDFRVLARFLGTRCPWLNERQLGTRLADSEKTLKKAGWEMAKRRVHGRDEHIYTRRKL